MVTTNRLTDRQNPHSNKYSYNRQSLTSVLLHADADQDKVGGGVDGVIRNVDLTVTRSSVTDALHCRLLTSG